MNFLHWSEYSGQILTSMQREEDSQWEMQSFSIELSASVKKGQCSKLAGNQRQAVQLWCQYCTADMLEELCSFGRQTKSSATAGWDISSKSLCCPHPPACPHHSRTPDYFFFFLSLTDVKMTKDPHSFILQAISQMLFKCFHACLGSEKRLLR